MSLNKIENFQNLNRDEIAQKIIELKKDIFNLRFKKATKQNIKSHIFKLKKRELAQLLTIEQEKNK